MRRVVITGLGAVTPLGEGADASFAGLVAGRSGAGPITRFDARNFPTTFAAEVKGFDLGRYVAAPERWEYSGHAVKFALAATRMALADAGLLTPGPERSRFGVYLGTGEGKQDFHALLRITGRSYDPDSPDGLDHLALAREAMSLYDPRREYEQELHTPSAHLAEVFGLEGPNFACLTACAAGTQALGEAAQLIRHGDADLMLAGGAHSMVYELGLTGFSRLTALSRRNDDPCRASRPFDAMRDGFVLGEGAGLLVLEEMEHARRRGAVIHAELTGYGSTCDAFRVTDCHPEGRGAIACIRAALADARLSPEQVGYVNAHGTSTRNNDLVETLALKHALGEHVRRVPVSSIKSMIGHLIAGAGAVEAVVTVLAMRQGVLPPTINYEYPDPACDLDYVPNTAREWDFDHAISNSFGFGGQNAVVVLSRFRG